MLIVHQPLVLKIRTVPLSWPLALKGSRFFINHLTPSISLLISGISEERGDVSLGILKSSLVNIWEKLSRVCWTISWEGFKNKVVVCLFACFSCYSSSFLKVIPIWFYISSFCLYIQLLLFLTLLLQVFVNYAWVDLLDINLLGTYLV